MELTFVPRCVGFLKGSIVEGRGIERKRKDEKE